MKEMETEMKISKFKTSKKTKQTKIKVMSKQYQVVINTEFYTGIVKWICITIQSLIMLVLAFFHYTLENSVEHKLPQGS